MVVLVGPRQVFRSVAPVIWQQVGTVVEVKLCQLLVACEKKESPGSFRASWI